MAIFRECPYCGCNLDPGEKCDCQQDEEDEEILEQKNSTPNHLSVQVTL